MHRVCPSSCGQPDGHCRQTLAKRKVCIRRAHVQPRLDPFLYQTSLSQAYQPVIARQLAGWPLPDQVQLDGHVRLLRRMDYLFHFRHRSSSAFAFSERRSSSNMASAAIVLIEEPPEITPDIQCGPWGLWQFQGRNLGGDCRQFMDGRWLAVVDPRMAPGRLHGYPVTPNAQSPVDTPARGRCLQE